MKRNLFRITLLVLFCESLFSQNSPIKVTIYSSDSASKQTTQPTDKPFNSAGLYQNLFKWNYALAGRGILMFNYERHISDNFTFEMGLGITYEDFFFTTYYEIGNFSKKSVVLNSSSSNGVTNSQSLLPNPFENSAKKTGFALEVSPRYYIDKDEFEGFYVSPYVSYRKYNYAVTVDETNNNNGMYSTNSRTFDNLYYSFIDIGGKVGYQYYFLYNERLYYDFYFGFAYRNASVNTLMLTSNNNNGYNSDTYSEYTQKFGLPQVMMGAKLGLSF